MFFDNVKKLKEERDYWKSMYEELKAQMDELEEMLAEEEEIEELESKPKRKYVKTTFELLNIPIGTKLYFTRDRNIYVRTIDNNNKVAYDNVIWNISALAMQLLSDYYGHPCQSANGFEWFYEGEDKKNNLYVRRQEILKRREEE